MCFHKPFSWRNRCLSPTRIVRVAGKAVSRMFSYQSDYLGCYSLSSNQCRTKREMCIVILCYTLAYRIMSPQFTSEKVMPTIEEELRFDFELIAAASLAAVIIIMGERWSRNGCT